MTKYVEVDVIMFRMFLVEVPEGVAFPGQWAVSEVRECALTKQDDKSVIDIDWNIVEDEEYLAVLKDSAELVNFE